MIKGLWDACTSKSYLLFLPGDHKDIKESTIYYIENEKKAIIPTYCVAGVCATPGIVLWIHVGYVFSDTWDKWGNIGFTQWRNHVEVLVPEDNLGWLLIVKAFSSSLFLCQCLVRVAKFFFKH